MKKQALKKSTLSAVEAPVKDSLSPDYNEDLEIIEAIYLAGNFASRENSAQSSSYGKMFPVLSRRTKVEILRESSPNLQGGILTPVNGEERALSAHEQSQTTPSLIGFSIRGFSESPKDGAESTLSQSWKYAPTRNTL